MFLLEYISQIKKKIEVIKMHLSFEKTTSGAELGIDKSVIFHRPSHSWNLLKQLSAKN